MVASSCPTALVLDAAERGNQEDSVVLVLSGCVLSGPELALETVSVVPRLVEEAFEAEVDGPEALVFETSEIELPVLPLIAASFAFWCFSHLRYVSEPSPRMVEARCSFLPFFVLAVASLSVSVMVSTVSSGRRCPSEVLQVSSTSACLLSAYLTIGCCLLESSPLRTSSPPLWNVPRETLRPNRRCPPRSPPCSRSHS